MDPRSLQAQLLAIRAQVDALLIQLGEAAGPAPGDAAADEKCPHPVNHRRDLSVMGGPERWECQLCGHEETVSDS